MAMTYRNIHQYLDEAFRDNPNPSDAQVALAKKEYYRIWHREYNRMRRKRLREFTLGFDAKTLSRINQARGTQSVSKYLYGAVHNALDGGKASNLDKQRLVSIHQELVGLIALVEEFGESPQMEDILDRLEALELQIANLYG